MKTVWRVGMPLVDVILMPWVYLAAGVLKAVRRAGVHRMPLCKSALLAMGVFPIRNHYYEPLFDARSLRRPLDLERELPGIDWNIDGQLQLLARFHFGDELLRISTAPAGELNFHLHNGAFESGDADYLYQWIRLTKPARLFEIGSGHSTLIARHAIAMNQAEDAGYRCKHLCIEPYEMPWLERTGAQVLRQRVEDVDPAVFSELGPGDLLFIDSSHIIRPQGDVLFEYLELLPSLKRGVVVHVHDIFSPRDYLAQWVVDEVRLWNEQYLLEAFLTSNPQWRVVSALNHLHHHHYDRLREKCPLLTPGREPVSFYMEKIA